VEYVVTLCSTRKHKILCAFFRKRAIELQAAVIWAATQIDIRWSWFVIIEVIIRGCDKEVGGRCLTETGSSHSHDWTHDRRWLDPFPRSPAWSDNCSIRTTRGIHLPHSLPSLRMTANSSPVHELCIYHLFATVQDNRRGILPSPVKVRVGTCFIGRGIPCQFTRSWTLGSPEDDDRNPRSGR